MSEDTQTLFTGSDAKAARQMAEMIALAMELRGHNDLARLIRRWAEDATGLTAAEAIKPEPTDDRR